MRRANPHARRGQELRVAGHVFLAQRRPDRMGIAGHQPVTDIRQTRVVLEPEFQIGRVEERRDVGRVRRAFDQAAQRDQEAQSALALQQRQFAQDRTGLFARVMDEAAGVHQADIGVGRILGDQQAGLGELAQDALGIDQVLRATQTDETDDGYGLTTAFRIQLLFSARTRGHRFFPAVCGATVMTSRVRIHDARSSDSATPVARAPSLTERITRFQPMRPRRGRTTEAPSQTAMRTNAAGCRTGAARRTKQTKCPPSMRSEDIPRTHRN